MTIAVLHLPPGTIYPAGIKVSDADMAALHIIRDAFHGEWNYTIKPYPRQVTG